jgi:hypothetical protein
MRLMFATDHVECARVELRLHEEATSQQYRELGLFVRDCIDRMERELGRAASWKIKIVPDRVCFSCDVSVQLGDAVVEANGNGFDGAVAGWEAFQEIEYQLRALIGTDVTHRAPAACHVLVAGRFSPVANDSAD